MKIATTATSYLTTWLGEHQNESDMAFYSTYPVRQHRGPGHRARRIRRLSDDAAAAAHVRRVVRIRITISPNSKPERLLMAAWITRSSASWSMWRPSRRARFSGRSPARFGRKIVYIPIGQLSPVALKKLRVVHVLDGYDKRRDRQRILLVKRCNYCTPPESPGCALWPRAWCA